MYMFLLFVAVGPPIWAFLLMAAVLVLLHFSLPQRLEKLVRDRTYRAHQAIQLFRRTGWGWLMYLAPVSGGMPGTVVGTQMNVGYPGTFSRNGDCIIEQAMVRVADTVTPNFGDAVVLNFDAAGDVSSAAQSIANAVPPVMGIGVAASFMGFAAREVKTMTSFVSAPGASAVLGGYTAGNIMDIIVRGSVVVQLQNPSGTAMKKGGKVYLRLAAGTGTVLGAIEPAADGGNTVQLTNCIWTTGITSLDANGNTVVEVTILARNN